MVQKDPSERKVQTEEGEDLARRNEFIGLIETSA